jgi:RimJ/RimL family protein N-acetyltransferase
MEIFTDNLILRTVTIDDLNEVSRMWNFEKGSISLEKAEIAIKNMQSNHKKNKPEYIYHICFAVFEKDDNKRIIGWCGLDGIVDKGKTVIFYLIDKEYRNRGYATQCASKLLEYAFETVGLKSVYGGCYKENIASYKVQEKVGMLQNAFEENGDPLFFIDDRTYFQKIKNI